MPRPKSKFESEKYTTHICKEHLNKIRELHRQGKFPSVSEGINVAIAHYLDSIEKQRLDDEMLQAAEDKEFVKRINMSLFGSGIIDGREQDDGI
jgi:Arc/MetJ-type ribon-helix-helix transcriptional regulator